MEETKKEATQEMIDEMKEKIDNNLTISTKLSTEQLICKTPQGSPSASLKSHKEAVTTTASTKTPLKIDGKEKSKTKETKVRTPTSSIVYWATMQILFGVAMMVAGSFVIYYKASLHQIGAGLWGGCLSTVTGVIGTIAMARRLCPLKEATQRVAHTIYLATSLICVAVSQLVLVLAATGLARDLSKSKEDEEAIDPLTERDPMEPIRDDYYVLLCNIGLILSSGLQFTCSVVSSYKSARKLCSCFRGPNDDHNYKRDYSLSSHAIVSSWLGKHNATTPFYVVATAAAPSPPSIGSRSKLSTNYPTSIYAMPPAMLTPPQMLRYPLIPAPLGPIATPLIPPACHHHHHHNQHHRVDKLQQRSRDSRDYAVPLYVTTAAKKSHEVREPTPITTEDVAKTYTGLDRVIAEEFIEICDSRNNSLCSNSSCQSCNKSDECNCQSNDSTKSSMSDETFVHCTESKCSKC